MKKEFADILKRYEFCELGGVIALTDKNVYTKLVNILEETEAVYCTSKNEKVGIYMISVKGLSLLS